MLTRDTILAVLRTSDDPEMPISIVDLGIVEDVRIAEADADPAEQVEIDILPTFIGCPAPWRIRSGQGARMWVQSSPAWFGLGVPDSNQTRLALLAMPPVRLLAGP